MLGLFGLATKMENVSLVYFLITAASVADELSKVGLTTNLGVDRASKLNTVELQVCYISPPRIWTVNVVELLARSSFTFVVAHSLAMALYWSISIPSCTATYLLCYISDACSHNELSKKDTFNSQPLASV